MADAGGSAAVLAKRPEPALHSAVVALVRALQAAGVEFIRYTALDNSGTTRAKALPLETMVGNEGQILNGVSFVECLMSLPIFGDMIAPGSGAAPAGLMQLKPDLDTLRVLPYQPTHARVFGNFVKPDESYSPLCPRSALQRLMQASGLGLSFTVGAEMEFVLYKAGTDEPADTTNFAASQPYDFHAEFIRDLYHALSKQGVAVDMVHAEATTGQLEAVLKYCDPVSMADNIVVFRDTLAVIARKHGLTATQCPKPVAGACGNGMHLHFAFADASGKNSFPDASHPTGISKEGRAMMAGFLENLDGIVGVTMPSVNSYERAVPGTWSGAFKFWGVENKEAPLRLCSAGTRGIPYHFELKSSDATGNYYLSLAACLACGMDGIRRGLELPPPINGVPDAVEGLARLPDNLGEALNHTEKNKLIQDAVGAELLQYFIAVKRCEADFFKGKDLTETMRLYRSKGL